MATSRRGVVDYMRTNPASLRPGLPPPDARGADRAAWQFANRRGRALEPIDLLLHATDQGTRLVLPIHAFGLAARSCQAEDALGLRPDRGPHLIGQRDLGRNVRYDPVRADETDDLRVWRFTGDAGANLLLGHLRLHPCISTERSNRSRFTTSWRRPTAPPYVRKSGSGRGRRIGRGLRPGRRLGPGSPIGIRRPIRLRLVLLSVIRRHADGDDLGHRRLARQMCYDGGLNGAQKLLLIIARHLDIGQVDTKVTPGQPSFDSHRIPLGCSTGFVEFHRSNVNWKQDAPAFPADVP
jgi:hypothetical protein